MVTLRRSILAGSVVLGLASAARAQPLAGGFQYQVSEQLADCPGRDELTAQIGEMSRRGRPPADPPLVEVSLYPQGEGIGGTIRLLRDHEVAGQRELSLPVRDCRELARTVALAVAIALDPELAQPPAERPRERTVAPPPPVPAATVSVEQPVPPPAPLKLAVAPRAGAAFGLAPSPMPVAAAGLSLGREALSLRLELLVGGLGQKEVAGGRVGAWLAGAGLLPCGHLGRASLCGGGWAAFYRAGASDLAEARGHSGLWLGLGGRATMSLFSVWDLGFSLVGELMWSTRRFRLTDSQTGDTFWLMPPLGGTAGLELTAPL